MLYKADTGLQKNQQIHSDQVQNGHKRLMWAVEVSEFPDVYVHNHDILIPTPEYVAWLEEKLETLNPKQ